MKQTLSRMCTKFLRTLFRSIFHLSPTGAAKPISVFGPIKCQMNTMCVCCTLYTEHWASDRVNFSFSYSLVADRTVDDRTVFQLHKHREVAHWGMWWCVTVCVCCEHLSRTYRLYESTSIAQMDWCSSNITGNLLFNYRINEQVLQTASLPIRISSKREHYGQSLEHKHIRIHTCIHTWRGGKELIGGWSHLMTMAMMMIMTTPSAELNRRQFEGKNSFIHRDRIWKMGWKFAFVCLLVYYVKRPSVKMMSSRDQER